MLKKSITYEDFEGRAVTEDFYFHLSKADLVELEVSRKGGLEAYLKDVVKSEDGKAILAVFKELIAKAVGEKSEDGKRFLKTDEIRQDFMASPAYDALFMELVTDAEKSAEFVNAIIPAGLRDEAEMIAANAKATKSPLEKVFDEAKPAPRVLTPLEMAEMDADELKSGLRTGRYKLSNDKLS